VDGFALLFSTGGLVLGVLIFFTCFWMRDDVTSTLPRIFLLVY